MNSFRKLLDRKHKEVQKKAWSKEEDDLLKKLHSEGLSWEEIAKRIGTPSPKNCLRRLERLKRQNRRWPEELEEMIQIKFEVDGKKWKNIAIEINEVFPHDYILTASILRDHYYNFLKPGIERRAWNFEEDYSLIELVL